MVQPLETHQQQQQQQLCGATLTRRQKARAESFFPPSLTNTRTRFPGSKSSQFCSILHLQEGEENFTRLKNKSNQIRSRNLPHVIQTRLFTIGPDFLHPLVLFDDILARVGGVWDNSLLVVMSQIRPVMAFVTL